MSSSDPTLELLGLVTNADLFKQRLAEFAKMKDQAEKTMADAERARQAAAEFVKLAEQSRQEHMAHIAASQATHDQTAKEAAKRIQVGNDQATELLRIQDEVDRREKAVAQRESELSQAQIKLDKDTRMIDERFAKLQSQKAELDARAE